MRKVFVALGIFIFLIPLFPEVRNNLFTIGENETPSPNSVVTNYYLPEKQMSLLIPVGGPAPPFSL